MEYRKKLWSDKHKEFRVALGKKETFNQAINLFMELHSEVHSSKVTKESSFSFEDELWDNLDEHTFRKSVNKKGRTIAYGMWHSTRIEDMTMNLLVTDGLQVIDNKNWQEKLYASIYDTGNALSKDEILTFSSTINMNALKEYRTAVGKRTRELVSLMEYQDLKGRVSKFGLEKIVDIGAVVKKEEAIWLIDYWKSKTVEGILLMPCTRHLFVHIKESMDAKRKSK